MVVKLKSSMGSLKYTHFAVLALNLLIIPASNADSEHALFNITKLKSFIHLLTQRQLLLINCHSNNT